MRERGIDITGEFPKLWTSEIVQAADMVVTMGCGDACPVGVPAGSRIQQAETHVNIDVHLFRWMSIREGSGWNCWRSWSAARR
jgi:protein-tyrosine-phosphatase